MTRISYEKLHEKYIALKGNYRQLNRYHDHVMHKYVYNQPSPNALDAHELRPPEPPTERIPAVAYLVMFMIGAILASGMFIMGAIYQLEAGWLPW